MVVEMGGGILSAYSGAGWSNETTHLTYTREKVSNQQRREQVETRLGEGTSSLSRAKCHDVGAVVAIAEE